MTNEWRHVVQTSGGEASWAAAKLVAGARATGSLWQVFCDTLAEHHDTYRFLVEGVANVLGLPVPPALPPLWEALPPLWEPEARREQLARLAESAEAAFPRFVWLQEGRGLWEVFRDEQLIGNTRADPCSKFLKRRMAAAWLDAECDPTRTTVYVGISWDEIHRFEGTSGKPGLRQRMAAQGWRCEAPLCEPPYPSRPEIARLVGAAGLRRQELYRLGFPHANCHGRCVKAGHAHWELYLRTFPEAFDYDAREEEALRQTLGKDVSVLRDRRGGRTLPLPLTEFRRRTLAGAQPDLHDWGGCGCFAGDPGGED